MGLFGFDVEVEGGDMSVEIFVFLVGSNALVRK